MQFTAKEREMYLMMSALCQFRTLIDLGVFLGELTGDFEAMRKDMAVIEKAGMPPMTDDEAKQYATYVKTTYRLIFAGIGYQYCDYSDSCDLQIFRTLQGAIVAIPHGRIGGQMHAWGGPLEARYELSKMRQKGVKIDDAAFTLLDMEIAADRGGG